jgi:hypothetical protein
MKFSRIDFLYAASLLHKTKEAPTLTPTREGKVSFPLTLALSLVGEREIKELGFHRERKIEVTGLLRAVFR